MDYERSVQPITVLKTKSAQLVRDARRGGRPIIITQNGKATAVLQDIESFQRQREALMLLRFLVTGEQQLQRGHGVANDKAAAHFRRRLAELKREHAISG